MAAVLLVGAACQQPSTVDNQPGSEPSIIETTPETPLDSEEGGPAVHPVSIPALAQAQLDGRDLALGRVLDDNATYTRYFVTYKSSELTISGIMNIPKGNGPFPVLILNHGYIDRSVYTNGRGLKREQDYLARNGFAVLHIDYRCHAQSDCDNPDELALRLNYAVDAMNAVQAVRSSNHPKLDGNRIGMLGHSMGGGVTLTSITAKPDLINAAVLFAPVSSDAVDNFERWTTRRPDDAQEIVEKYGDPTSSPAFWDDVSPRTFFENVAVPLQIHHGARDESVPLEWSDATAAALREVGKTVENYTYPGQPHEFTSAWGTVMGRTAAFFRENLK
ncbi:MAG: alpha/beta fold hydrolase [Candidatus Kerfeldbacteria bacterium]|nr:alpha/beta fold hydrolase [Candidatus Kerfeldbacteria bacterium]